MQIDDNKEADFEDLRDDIRDIKSMLAKLSGYKATKATGDAEFITDIVRREIESRSIREDLLKHGRLGEIGWEILLTLYLDIPSEHKLSVGDVGHKVNAPLTTIIRKLDIAADANFLRRYVDNLDNRRTVLQITRKGMRVVETWAARFNEL